MAQSPLRTPSLLGYGKGAPSLLGYGKPAPTWTQAELDAASIERARSSRTSDPITQAWQSAGEGIAAGDLNEAALAAQQEGDNVRAQDLLRRAGVAQERAKVLANDTPGFTEIDGVGSAANWFGGAVGSMGRSAAPAIGAGLVGAAAGAATAGPAGAAVGGLRGLAGAALRYIPAAAVSYDQLRGENVTQQFADPEVAARPADERARNASVTAAFQTLPEMFLPQRAVSAVTNRIANSPGGHRAVGGVVDSLGEGFTETLQQEMGYQGLQATGSTAERNPDDYINAFTAGVAGGAGISTVSNAAGYGLDKLLPNATQPAPVPPPADPNAPAIPTVEELATNSAKSVAKTVTDIVEDPIMFGARALNRDKTDAVDLKNVKDPDALAAAIAARDAQGAEHAGAAAQAILEQDRFTPSEKRRVEAMNGNYADPANQTAIAATLGFSRLREIGSAFIDQGKKWLDSIVGALDRTTRNNLQNFDTSPMVDALAPIFEERAPAAAEFFIKMSQAMENPDAKLPPEMEKHLAYIADRMAGNKPHNATFLDALKATGATALAKQIEYLQNVPGASRDVATKQNSLFDQLFDDTNTQYTRSQAAKLLDQVSLQFGTATKAQQQEAIKRFTPVFGSEANARALIDHYGKVRTEYFKETAGRLPPDDQNTRGVGRVKGTKAAVANGDLREEDLKGMTAGYRASNPSRPFFAAEDAKELEEAVAAGGPEARAAGMDEYIKLTEQSPAEAFGRIRHDLEKRLRGSRNKDKGWLTAQLEKAVAEGADLKTRQDLEKKIAKAEDKRSDLPRLEAEWAKLEEASPSAEDANENRFDKALSLYKVAMRGADNTLATDEDIHRFGRMLRVARNIKPPKKPEKPEGNDPLDERVYREQMADYAEKADAYRKKMEDIKRTEIHFRKKNGDILKLSAESMIYASPVHGSDLKRLLASVAMVRARPDIASIENFNVDTLAIREGEKRKAKTIGELRGVKKERKTQRATDLVDATKLQADARVKRVAKRAEATKVERVDKRAKQAAAKVERDAMDNMNRDHYRRQFAVDTVEAGEGKRDVVRPIAPPIEERAAAELPAVEKKLEETAAEIDVVKTERKMAFEESKNTENLTWKEFEASPKGLEFAQKLASLKAALSIGRSQQRVLTEFVIEGLEKTFPLPNKNEFTHDLADDVLMEGGFDENRLTEAYTEEKLGVLYERLAAVLSGVSMRDVQQLEKHRKRLETATQDGEIDDILNSIDLILEDAGDFSTRVVERIQKEITETENDLDDMLEEGAHHPEQLARHRMKDNPTRYYQNEENFFYIRRMLATAIAQAEHNRDLIPGMEADLQDKLAKLRGKTNKGRNANALEVEHIRSWEMALGRLRRVKAKRPEDAPVSYSVKGGKHLTKPLDPGVTYNNQKEQSTDLKLDYNEGDDQIMTREDLNGADLFLKAAWDPSQLEKVPSQGAANPSGQLDLLGISDIPRNPRLGDLKTPHPVPFNPEGASKPRPAKPGFSAERPSQVAAPLADVQAMADRAKKDAKPAAEKPMTPKERNERAQAELVAGRRMDAVRAFLEEINRELLHDNRLTGTVTSAEGGRLPARPPAEVVRIDSPVQKLSDKELVDRSVVAALALLRLRQAPKLDINWGPRASEIARAAMAARAEAAVKVSEEYGKLRDERDAREAKQSKQAVVTKTTAKPAMPLALKQAPRGGVKTNAPPLASAAPKDAMSTADTTDVKKAKLYVKLAKRQQAALDKAAQPKEKASEKEQGRGQGRREEGRREEVLKRNAQSPGTGSATSISDAEYDQKMTDFAEQIAAVASDFADAELALAQAHKNGASKREQMRLIYAMRDLQAKHIALQAAQAAFVVANTLPIPQSYIDELKRVRGPAVTLAFVRGFMQGSGSYTRTTLNGVVDRAIKLAATAPIGVLYHEMLHDFFAEIGNTKQLRQLKADLLRAADRPFVVKQLEQLLAGHPAALQQLKDPEERLAYAYQFWAEGHLRITQDGEGLFKRIAKFLRNTLNILTLDEKLERTLIELHNGRMTTPSDVQTALAKLETLSDKIDRKMPAVHRTFHRLFGAAVDQLHAMNSPSISKLADMFYNNANQSGFLVKKAEAEGAWRNKYHNIVKKYSPQEIKAALANLQSMKPARGAGLERELREFFQEIHEYMLGKGVQRRVELPFTGPGTGGYTYGDFNAIRNYFPRIWDPQALVKHKDEFIAKLVQHGKMGQREAEQTYNGILADSKKRDPAGGGITPFAAATISRSLKFIDERTSHDFTKYQLQDMNEIMDSYIRQSTHRAEYASLFGNSGEIIDDLLERAMSEIAKTGVRTPEVDRARVIISAMDGTMNDIMDPKYKNIMAGVLTLQNWVLLPLAVFSQLIDPLGIAVRTGDIRDAGAAYMRVLTDLGRWTQGKVDDVKAKLGKPVTRTVIQDRHRDMAHILGAVQRDASFDSINHAFGSMYMSKGLRNANTLLFRINGMQGINDSFRTAAVVAGERYILEHREDARRMEELGLKPSDIVEKAPGELDIDSPKMKEAMFRFVDGAIVRPNAAHRAVWMSDPRFMLVTHLKQFAFSFQKVVLERVTHELKNNNSAPLMMLAAYAPVMLAADMAKWIMFGNYPEHWTAMDFFGHAINRSGLLGKFSFGTDVYGDFTHGEIPGTSFLGPTADHLSLLGSWLTGGAETSDVIERSVPLARLLPM